MSIASIEVDGVAGIRAFLDGLAAELREKRYRPQPLRRVHIPKPGQPGQTRSLGISLKTVSMVRRPHGNHRQKDGSDIHDLVRLVSYVGALTAAGEVAAPRPRAGDTGG